MCDSPMQDAIPRFSFYLSFQDWIFHLWSILVRPLLHFENCDIFKDITPRQQNEDENLKSI